MKLIVPTRTCAVCGCEGSYNRKIMADKEPVILAINLTIYRRTRTGRQPLATSKRVRVCETCFIKAAAGRDLDTGGILGFAFISQASDCYSAMVDPDKKLSKAEKRLAEAR